jgi:crossover junction endodeoxyribonuclease RuvC
MTDAHPLILALDIATVCGFARGRVGETPVSGSIRFGRRDASNNAIFAHALTWISKELEPQPRPDIIIIESMLPADAKYGFTNRDTRDRLAGLHGVVRAVAHLRGVFDISEAGVGQVRAHFIGHSNLKRPEAKRQVILRCAQLGWQASDDNAGDALALWSYAVGLIDPQWALHLSPLFNRKLRAAS